MGGRKGLGRIDMSWGIRIGLRRVVLLGGWLRVVKSRRRGRLKFQYVFFPFMCEGVMGDYCGVHFVMDRRVQMLEHFLIIFGMLAIHISFIMSLFFQQVFKNTCAARNTVLLPSCHLLKRRQSLSLWNNVIQRTSFSSTTANMSDANENTQKEKKSYHTKATGAALATVKKHSKEHSLRLYGGCFWYYSFLSCIYCENLTYFHAVHLFKECGFRLRRSNWLTSTSSLILTRSQNGISN
jgi:hypothetical protein